MKLRKFLPTVIALLMLAAPAGAYAASAGRWETVKSERTEGKTVARDQETEIRAGRGVIYVTTSHPATIKVFTILGQVISAETIPAGTSQLNLGSHGIYIIKIGDLTCKVAL